MKLGVLWWSSEPGFGSPTSEIQGQPLGRAPRLHKLHSIEEKEREKIRGGEKRKKIKQKRTERQNPKTNGKSNIK